MTKEEVLEIMLQGGTNADGLTFASWLYHANFSDQEVMDMDAFDYECVADAWKSNHNPSWYSSWTIKPESRIDNQGDSCSIPRPAPTLADSKSIQTYKTGRSVIAY